MRVPDTFYLKASCFAGYLPDIVGRTTCLRVVEGGALHVVEWHAFRSGGGGGFGYTRHSFDAGDACDRCWSVLDPDQADSDQNCPAAPYASAPACGDACQ